MNGLLPVEGSKMMWDKVDFVCASAMATNDFKSRMSPSSCRICVCIWPRLPRIWYSVPPNMPNTLRSFLPKIFPTYITVTTLLRTRLVGSRGSVKGEGTSDVFTNALPRLTRKHMRSNNGTEELGRTPCRVELNNSRPGMRRSESSSAFSRSEGSASPPLGHKKPEHHNTMRFKIPCSLQPEAPPPDVATDSNALVSPMLP
jgi:hypothetical protein